MFFFNIFQNKLKIEKCNISQSSGFLRRPQKFEKNLLLVLTLLSKNSCFVKTGGRFFQILWPSYNVLTLK